MWYQFLSKLDIRFVRQKPIDNYILDFYCPEKKIGIELDGSQHYTADGMEYDRVRTEILNGYKIEIIRFTNIEIRKEFKEVCQHIENIINSTENRKQV